MNRKKFLRNSILGLAGLTLGTKKAQANNQPSTSTYDKLMDQVGFNHLPNHEIRTMKTVVHKANTRGHANHGWLDTHHSFSFANYYNPERMHFGVLRVLNDDRVAAGRGFGKHPHDNMEIVSIPLEGDLEHQDSMGNVAVIKEGDVQVMSAGTGVFHSEFNKNPDQEVKFLQIWMFPRQKGVEPRYDQISLDKSKMKNTLHQILSPNQDDEGVWVHQDAWWYMGELEAGCTETYRIKRNGNGVYAFILEGEVAIAGQPLERRDGMGIWDTEEVEIEVTKDAKVLLMDVPMTIG
jgi:redox-sensitive bicupin YhaK (pirin superfamily)